MEQAESQFYTHNKTSDVNATKVVVKAGKTVIYGQTPKTVCKEHFDALAEKMGRSANDLAREVVKMTVDERLDLLRRFYEETIPESKEIYQSLRVSRGESSRRVVELEVGKQNASPQELRRTRRKRKIVRKLSSSNSEDSVSQHDGSDNVQTTFIASTVADRIETQTEAVTLDEQYSSRNSVEEFEAFLFGKVAPRKKPPPAVKPRTSAATPEVSGQVFPLETSPSKPGFVQPAITFDSSKWSPAPQRSMLDIVKDLSRAKRMLETGEIPSSSVPFI